MYQTRPEGEDRHTDHSPTAGQSGHWNQYCYIIVSDHLLKVDMVKVRNIIKRYAQNSTSIIFDVT